MALEFGSSDPIFDPQPENRPSALPSLPPGTPEMKAYDPTVRERMASGLQSALEKVGMSRQSARGAAQSVMGGASSKLPLNMGLADVVPFVGTGLQTQEAARGMEAAAQSAQQGDYIGAGVEGAFGLMGLIPGAAGTKKAIQGMRAKSLQQPTQIQGKLEDRSIPAPFRAQEGSATGVTYETAQEGPFYRVRPNLPQATGRQNRGTKEGVGSAQAGRGPTGGDVPQPVTDETVQQVINQPDNFVRQVANQYSLKSTGSPYELPEIPESSLIKQAPIGRTFALAATDDPAYKRTVFDAYATKFPQLVEQSGAQNYDQLMEAAYRQLARETEQQFRSLPINMSYHRAGEGNYENSKELLRDIYGNRHMYVFQGGDPHDFLNAVDPASGLNTNEMFRAVHDFFGHAIHGNQFGPKGEEIAWAAHSKMFSPLARLAMTSETRGQNSFVNYTPLNAELKAYINDLNAQAYEAERRGQTDMLKEINKDLAEAWSQFQFAPQKSLILPPEFLDLNYSGGMPKSIEPLIQPARGTTTGAQLTHFSTRPDLTMTDPAMYGTGIKGAEMARLQGTPGAVMERSYFYAGDPASVKPEVGLGPYRYGAQAESLYDVAADPLKLGTLATESNRIPFTAKANKGLIDRNPVTDLERLAKEYGYEGVINPNLSQPTAIMFKPTPVQRQKQGGEVKMAPGGGVKDALKDKLKQMLGATTKAVPDEAAAKAAAKQRFLEPSKERDVWYHGTPDDVEAFDPGWRGFVSLTKDTDFASGYSMKKPRDRTIRTSPNVMPVYTQIQNPFDYENPEHIEAVMKLYKKPESVDLGNVRDQLELGNWNFIEDKNVQQAIKDSGFDSFYMKEHGVKNLGVYDPKRIKSAIGMQGQYDITNPKVTKKKGGKVQLTDNIEEMRLQLAKGGGMKEAVKAKIKEVAKGTQEILPPEEREKNLKKFLEDSQVKRRVYHGTKADFGEFRPNERGAHFVTSDPRLANAFAGEAVNPMAMKFHYREGANVMPLYVQAKKPFDYENKSHIDELFKQEGPWTKNPDRAGYLREGLGRGYWSLIEDKEIQDALKKAGFDSFFVQEGGFKNLGVFEPNQIKSATGNRGTFDPTKADVNKAAGGAVSPDPLRNTLKGMLGMAVGGSALKEKAKEKVKELARAAPKSKEEIYSIAERMAPQVTGEYVREKPTSAKTVAGKTKKQFEREKTLPVDIRPTSVEKKPEVIDIEKMKDQVFVGIPGDPTVTGKTLYSVGDTVLESPAPQRGGPLYGLYHDDDHFWASGLNAATRTQNVIQEAAEQYGAPVVGKYIMMGPESINYALHFADANLQAIDLDKMSKTQIKQFNNLLRSGTKETGPRPAFPGIENKGDAYLYFSMDPGLRKYFNKLMQMNTVTDKFNLPSGQDIRFAITEPELRNLETGVTGFSLGQMRPDIPSTGLKLSEHPTYSHDIPGHMLGQTRYPIPYELSFADTLKSVRENPEQAPHEFGSLKMVGPRQKIDQQLIDEIRMYEERMRQLTGRKKGGPVKKAKKGKKVKISNNKDAHMLASLT